MKYRVITPHTASFDRPLRASAGTRLTYERRESEWPGWVWCTGPRSRSGWVPETWLRLGPSIGTLLQDYDAIELNVGEGEIVTGTVIVADWLWASTSDGTTGWVPLDCLVEVR